MKAPSDGGGPAFPVDRVTSASGNVHVHERPGMTLQAYAAIQLKVPNSGIDWLDEMITEAKRDELASHALIGLLSSSQKPDRASNYADDAYKIATAMNKWWRR